MNRDCKWNIWSWKNANLVKYRHKTLIKSKPCIFSSLISRSLSGTSVSHYTNIKVWWKQMVAMLLDKKVYTEEITRELWSWPLGGSVDSRLKTCAAEASIPSISWFPSSDRSLTSNPIIHDTDLNNSCMSKLGFSVDKQINNSWLSRWLWDIEDK